MYFFVFCIFIFWRLGLWRRIVGRLWSFRFSCEINGSNNNSNGDIKNGSSSSSNNRLFNQCLLSRNKKTKRASASHLIFACLWAAHTYHVPRLHALEDPTTNSKKQESLPRWRSSRYIIMGVVLNSVHRLQNIFFFFCRFYFSSLVFFVLFFLVTVVL